MKKQLFSLYLCLIVIGQVQATDYYVRTDGNDGNAGTGNNSSRAFRTLGKAAAAARPGDVINVADGIYTEGRVYFYQKYGSKNSRITLRAMNKHKAVLRSTSGTSAIEIGHSTGVTIDGLEVTFNTPARSYWFGIVSYNSFWVTVRNCYVHDVGSSGIQLNDGEYIFVENNVVRANAKNTGSPNGSGISIFHPKYGPGYQAGDFGIVIRNNICFENVCPINLPGFPTPVDGNGIILDDFRNTQTGFGGGQPGGYFHPSLVENNLVFNNGGRGIHLLHADNVTIRSNTLYHNNYELSKYYGFGWNGDLSVSDGNNTKIYNNIVVMRNTNPRGYALLIAGNNPDVRHNVIVGPAGKAVDSRQNPIEGAYPTNNKIQPLSNQSYVKFVKSTYNVHPVNSTNPQFGRFFGLATGSPAINAGYSASIAASDMEGRSGGTVDIGCYKSTGTVAPASDKQPPTAPANLVAVNRASTSISLSWTASSDNTGVTGYDVFRGSTLAGSVTGTSYTATSLTPNTIYTFTVKAKDAASNISAASNSLSVSTTGNTTTPPAATPPPPASSAGNGLKGEFYTSFGSSIAAARGAVSGQTPAFRFTSTTIDYPNGTSTTSGLSTSWGSWLGNNGSGAPGQSIETSTLKLTGFILIKRENDLQTSNSSIEVDFSMFSMGKTEVILNGNQKLTDETNWQFSNVKKRVSFPAPGYYSIEVLHSTSWDNSGIELYSSIPGSSNPGRGNAQTQSLIPQTVLFREKPAGARLLADDPNDKDPALATDMLVYPNPVRSGETLTISVDKELFPHAVSVRLIDGTGKTAYTQSDFNESGITFQPATSLPKGMYVLILTDGITTRNAKVIIH